MKHWKELREDKMRGKKKKKEIFSFIYSTYLKISFFLIIQELHFKNEKRPIQTQTKRCYATVSWR